jgi:hypothetical protein
LKELKINLVVASKIALKNEKRDNKT